MTKFRIVPQHVNGSFGDAEIIVGLRDARTAAQAAINADASVSVVRIYNNDTYRAFVTRFGTVPAAHQIIGAVR